MPVDPPDVDPLDDPCSNPDAYHGAILLSDQIQYYIDELDPPLIQNPSRDKISPQELEDCLDAASYKLRLGAEAHVGGERRRISEKEPLVIPAHQVAVVKTYELVNLPRFLIARWNLRVKWVYEGLLWVGGPQVDPGWQGELYCPIYNLAEREVVIPYKERFFTMDFCRTTPFREGLSITGYKPKRHKPGTRDKTLQGHDTHRIRSAPFESLRQLSSLDTRVTSFNNFTFLVLAVMIAAIGVVASFGGVKLSEPSGIVGGGKGLLILTILALVFGFSGLLISVTAIALKYDPVPRGRSWLALVALVGAALLSCGSVLLTLTAALEPPAWLNRYEALPWAVGFGLIVIGLGVPRLFVVQSHQTVSLNCLRVINRLRKNDIVR